MLLDQTTPYLRRMIVQEYGGDCPAPNRNTVYLSLLDSVKLPKTLLPSSLRTTIYHTIVRRYCICRWAYSLPAS